MRFMMLVKANADSEAGVLPSSEAIAEMGRFNDELIRAGVLLAAEGLHSSAKGVRLTYTDGGKPTVTDGPFAETKELLAGFWLIDVSSLEEAVEWASRAPFPGGETLEIRRVFEAEDFPADAVSQEALDKEQAWRDANQRPIQA
ncbi:YciI family protein [Kitasatospora sp. NPDC048540]|uniref:YciI family protein n=1 Tax=unclassified Kitasatospora TaxID=2633591 RepID=UPI00053A6667|nr:YciI family protein [Kitasatospora sp. MBT63]